MTVFFTDYGNRETISFADIRELPDQTWVSSFVLFRVSADLLLGGFQFGLLPSYFSHEKYSC